MASILQLAQKELQKINMYKAPRDKLVCILSYCKAINNILLNSSMASNDHPHGADDFLPVLIYVTIKVRLVDLSACLFDEIDRYFYHIFRIQVLENFSILVSIGHLP